MPAFSRPASRDDSGDYPCTLEAQSGLTKREYFAALALQGILAHPMTEDRHRVIADAAVAFADALIAALDGDS